MRTRVKICGITRVEDAKSAIDAGCDAIGLVFYPPSPRAVTPQQARQIIQRIPPFITVVGLFVDAGREAIAETLRVTRIDLLQFHGDESPEQCSGHGRPYIKALRMRDGLDLERLRQDYQGASALLLDAYRKGMLGGTGETFAWERIPAGLAAEIILAGGLTPDNVERAIGQVRPYAVDVSGGVERGKGIKDQTRIAAFMRGVMRANQ